MNTKIAKTVKIGCCCLAAAALTFAVANKMTEKTNDGFSAYAETAIVAEAATGTTVALDYVVNTDNTVTVTVSIGGDVCFASFVGELQYDSSVLTYSSSQAIYSGVYLNNSSAGDFAFSFASATNITSAVDMFSVTFAYSGTFNTNISLVITEGNFCTATFEDVTYTVSGGNIVVDGTENQTDSNTDSGNSSSSADTGDEVVSCFSVSGGSSFGTGLLIMAAGALLVFARRLRVKKAEN